MSALAAVLYIVNSLEAYFNLSTAFHFASSASSGMKVGSLKARIPSRRMEVDAAYLRGHEAGREAGEAYKNGGE